MGSGRGGADGSLETGPQSTPCIPFIPRISRVIKTTASAAAVRSATGAEYMTPSMPKNMGRMMISGSRNRICRVREIKIPFFALPMEVKKLAVMGWIPFRKVKNRKMRKYCSAKW